MYKTTNAICHAPPNFRFFTELNNKTVLTGFVVFCPFQAKLTKYSRLRKWTWFINNNCCHKTKTQHDVILRCHMVNEHVLRDWNGDGLNIWEFTSKQPMTGEPSRYIRHVPGTPTVPASPRRWCRQSWPRRTDTLGNAPRRRRDRRPCWHRRRSSRDLA